jgi:hypothetical protein
MHCGTPGRTPPRRPAAAGRLFRFAFILVLAAAIWAGPAQASYTCGGKATEPTRTLTARVTGEGEENCAPKTRVVRKADPMSFAFFIGIMVAVVLVPIALNKRGLGPPE